MATWYLSYKGIQVGPFDDAQAISKARENSNGYAWREGFGSWMQISHVPELTGTMPVSSSVPPPPTHFVGADVIDFKVCGAEMQYIEIGLDGGESVIAEAGALMYKAPEIRMESVFGTGQEAAGSFVDKLVGAGKRIVTGESMFVTVFTNGGSGKAHVAFAAPYPGSIVPIALDSIGGALICQKDSFLCAAKGVSIGVFLQKKILTGLFGGEGFIMQKLEGNGLAFVHAGGTVIERKLAPGEALHVDTGCVVAFEPTVDFQIERAGNIKTALFGGEGLFLASLRGPGRIWLQSLPFSRVAGRILSAASGGKEEGSGLGPLGNFLQGDRS